MIFSSIFRMLQHWLASKEGFSIKWQQLFRTCLNFIFLKANEINALKLKSKSKCDQIFPILFFLKFGEIFFCRNSKYCDRIFPLIIIFLPLAKFLAQKKKHCTVHTNPNNWQSCGTVDYTCALMLPID